MFKDFLLNNIIIDYRGSIIVVESVDLFIKLMIKNRYKWVRYFILVKNNVWWIVVWYWEMLVLFFEFGVIVLVL